MRRWVFFFIAAFFLAFLGFRPHGALAAQPMEDIKQTTDKIIAIVSNPDLKNPSKEPERRKLIRKVVDERFDWQELARRSLGPPWNTLTPEQKKNFTSLYSDLLERTYLERVESYSGEKVDYLGQNIDEDYATVDVRIVTAQNTEVPVIYRMIKKGNDWFVYDISISGVSLVNNYRAQFSSIISRSSFNGLVKELQRKVSEK